MIAAELLASGTLLLGWALYLPVLLWAAARAPWIELFSDLRRQHLLFGTVVVLFLLWLVRRDFASGLSMHFIGMTAVTLLLDWPLAILAGLLAQLGLIAVGRPDLASLGINGTLLVLIPVAITEACANLVERFQPNNLFVYIFCSGFFPAALTAIACVFAGLGLLPFSNAVHYDSAGDRRSSYHRLMAEGMLDGYAAADGAALHFVGRDLERVVTSRPQARAYRVAWSRGRVVETELDACFLGASEPSATALAA